MWPAPCSRHPADPDFSATVLVTFSRQPFEQDESSPLVTTVSDSAHDVLGHPATRRGEPFWTDCELLAEAGIPAVLIGVDSGGAHAAQEWVDLSSLHLDADSLRCGDHLYRLRSQDPYSADRPGQVDSPGFSRRKSVPEL